MYSNAAPFVAKKSLRAEIMKELNLKENQSLFVKSFGEKQSKEYKLESLEIRVHINPARDTHVGGIGFVIKSGPGVASIGSNNPFNNTKALELIKDDKGVYRINSKLKLLVTGAEMTTNEDGKKDAPPEYLSGEFSFHVSIADQKSIFLETKRVYPESYLRDVKVYGGEIFNDDSSLIYVTKFDSCGFHVLVKKNEAKMKYPRCMAMGC